MSSFLDFGGDPWAWVQVRDGHPVALEMYERHYSCYQYQDGRRRRLFVGPGQKVVLLTQNQGALFAWRKFISGNGQSGVNCAVFRKEHPGGPLASILIKQAELIGWQRWPGERFYTYVDPGKVESSNPGYCFRMAGWRRCGITQERRLDIWEKLP